METLEEVLYVVLQTCGRSLAAGWPHKATPEMRTPLYTGHFTRSPSCPGIPLCIAAEALTGLHCPYGLSGTQPGYISYGVAKQFMYTLSS